MNSFAHVVLLSVQALVVPTLSPAANNLVANGLFESPGTVSDFLYLSGANAGHLTPWSVGYDGNGEPSYVFHQNRYPVYDGNYSVTLNDGDSISQTVTLAAGVRHTIRFAALRTSDSFSPGTSENGALRVQCLAFDQTFDTFAGGTVSTVPASGGFFWRLFSASFVPAANSAVLMLANPPQGLQFGGITLDGVSITSCPADLNSDDQVDDADFSIFVVGYNILDCSEPAMPAGCPADLNADQVVDDSDFVIFVAAYNELLCP